MDSNKTTKTFTFGQFWQVGGQNSVEVPEHFTIEEARQYVLDNWDDVGLAPNASYVPDSDGPDFEHCGFEAEVQAGDCADDVSASEQKDLIFFYVEFKNSDSECYRGTRIPSIKEADDFVNRHFETLGRERVEIDYVDEITRERAAEFWNMDGVLRDDWPIFMGDAVVMD